MKNIIKIPAELFWKFRLPKGYKCIRIFPHSAFSRYYDFAKEPGKDPYFYIEVEKLKEEEIYGYY